MCYWTPGVSHLHLSSAGTLNTSHVFSAWVLGLELSHHDCTASVLLTKASPKPCCMLLGPQCNLHLCYVTIAYKALNISYINIHSESICTHTHILLYICELEKQRQRQQLGLISKDSKSKEKISQKFEAWYSWCYNAPWYGLLGKTTKDLNPRIKFQTFTPRLQENVDCKQTALLSWFWKVKPSVGALGKDYCWPRFSFS